MRVYGVDVSPEDRPYFVMEYADAGSLEERMKARAAAGERISIEEALATSIAVADGLVEAQGRSIVHRDLKPSNILFKATDGGPPRLVIADFGIARSLEAAGASTIAAGTPHYMAPEQSEGHADVGSDVYSAAVILFEMLAGRVPFPYPSVGQVIRAQISETVPDIRSLRPDVPDRLATVIARGVEARPEARQHSAEEWRADLLAVSEDRAASGPVLQETLGPEHLAALAERGRSGRRRGGRSRRRLRPRGSARPSRSGTRTPRPRRAAPRAVARRVMRSPPRARLRAARSDDVDGGSWPCCSCSRSSVGSRASRFRARAR